MIFYGISYDTQRFGKFSQAVEKFGKEKSKSNYFVFYINIKASIILLIVYVDDIVITESDTTGISSLKFFLYGQFHTKDLGMLKCFLGIEAMRSKHEIFLSQRKYVLDLLSETGNWEQNRVVPLWHQIYSLLEKENCLRS